MSAFRLVSDKGQAGKPRPGTRSSRRVCREQIEVTLDGGEQVPLLRVRDPRARRLRLSVDERGARLTLPPRASQACAERFVLDHAGWLLAQLERFSNALLPLQPHVTSCLPLRGHRVPLQWDSGRALRVAMDGEHIRFAVPPGASEAAVRRSLRDFYEAQTRTDIGRWLPEYLPGLPRPPGRIRLRVMSSQWGSLAPDGSMSLDLALILAPPDALRYVLVHELCHLIHANHSRAFWREVEARFPDWRGQRDYFKSEGRRLKAMLHALCGDVAA